MNVQLSPGPSFPEKSKCAGLHSLDERMEASVSFSGALGVLELVLPPEGVLGLLANLPLGSMGLAPDGSTRGFIRTQAST